MSNIEDILTSPLNEAVKLEDKNTSGNENDDPNRQKLNKIFKNTDMSNIGYEDDGEGNLIIGYRDIFDKDGNKIGKEPIKQSKLSLFDENNLLEIEVPLNHKKAGEKDELGLTQEERRRYDRLEKMNKATSGGRTKEELIAKAKNKSDLDASIIPEMMMHFITEKEEEDEFIDLTVNEKNYIKRLRRQGLMIEPEDYAGFNKSLKLATADKTIHARNFMVYLTHKGVDLSVANQETIDHFAKLYRQERRPGIDQVIEASIYQLEDIMYEKIKSSYDLSDEDQLQEYETQIMRLKRNPQLRHKLIEQTKSATGEEFYSMDDFRKVQVFLRVYGLDEVDSKYFNDKMKPDPRNMQVTMKDKFDQFKYASGYDFVDVYTYWWEKVEEMKRQDDLAKGIITDRTDIPSDGIPEELVEENINQRAHLLDEIVDIDEDEIL